MVDLRYLLNGNTLKHIATLKAVSLLFTCASAGTFIGGISTLYTPSCSPILIVSHQPPPLPPTFVFCTVSFLYKWSLSGPYVNRQLLTSLLLCLLGLSVASLPRLQHLWLLYGVSFAGFIGGGNHGAVAITWLAELWTGRVLAALMQAFQLSYGVGSIVGPLLARPYLWGLLNQTTLEELSDSEYWSTVEERRNSLAVPFTISGCLMGFGRLPCLGHLKVATFS